MLKGPTDLDTFRLVISSSTSKVVIGERKKLWQIDLLRNFLKEMSTVGIVAAIFEPILEK